MGRPLGLIVEDDADATLIFGQALQAAGFETKIIYSGSEALEWLASGKPDLIVLDVSLPRVSGIEILNAIRANPRIAKTPVIIATAYPHLAGDLQDKADLVLNKPITYSQLRDISARMYQAA